MNRKLALPALFTMATVLAACGGGESPDAPSPTPPPVSAPPPASPPPGSPPPPPPPAPVTYVTWIGSANGEVVKDGNNENFKVRTSDRAVVSMLSGKFFEGSFVDTNANLFINNVHVGAVVGATSTAGTQIVVFQCRNGRYLDFYNDTPTTYRWVC